MSSRRPPQLEKRAASMFCQYKLGYSLETIGKNFNISRQRVHKIISENPDYKPIKRDIALRDALGNHRRWYRIQELFDQLTLEQVMSASSYNFILEALFYAASH